MIHIPKSATADSRTCDFSRVTREELLKSSLQHINDVGQALAYFVVNLVAKSINHDTDKLTAIHWFHSDFITGFRETGWWDNHRKIHRHHLAQADGIPADVNLLDILEYIADCVMAGMARSGTVTPLVMSPELLTRAFENTVALLQSQVIIVDDIEKPTQRDRAAKMEEALLFIQQHVENLSDWPGNASSVVESFKIRIREALS